MKKYKILLSIAVASLAFGSCNEWLDVRPADQIGEEDLFSKGEGYRNALNGIYQELSEYDLYGRNLTWGITDALAQCYDLSMTSTILNDMSDGAAKYEYEYDVFKKSVENIWQKAYNAVANCNNLVNNITGADPDIFEYKEREKNMIWGEALALRAFIQFDLLRLFAASPAGLAKEGNPNKKYIPYISEYPSLAAPGLPVNECLDYIIRDLKAGRELVWEYDSLQDFRVSPRLEAKGDGRNRFFLLRGYRFNYYAISAALARVYLYAGKNKEAYEEAKKIIEYNDKNGHFDFRNQVNEGDLKFYSDVLMAFYSIWLTDWDRAANDVFSGSSECYMMVLNVKDIFGDEMNEDRRFTAQIEDYKGWGYYYRPLKYREQRQATTAAGISNELIPIIRMSEVYYIAGEVSALEGRLDEAKDYLFRVKKGRGIRTSTIERLKQSINNWEDYKAALRSDMRREFIGEGQIFYMYKRWYEEVIGDYETFPATEKMFVIPIPDSETNIK